VVLRAVGREKKSFSVMYPLGEDPECVRGRLKFKTGLGKGNGKGGNAPAHA